MLTFEQLENSVVAYIGRNDIYKFGINKIIICRFSTSYFPHREISCHEKEGTNASTTYAICKGYPQSHHVCIVQYG